MDLPLGSQDRGDGSFGRKNSRLGLDCRHQDGVWTHPHVSIPKDAQERCQKESNRQGKLELDGHEYESVTTVRFRMTPDFQVMAGVLCLGGGVLLATVFVHMMPEVRETLATAIYKMRQRAEEQHDSSHQSEHDYHR